jgi:predicted nucleotidyltransferase
MAANLEAVKEEAKRYANNVKAQLPIDKVYLFGSYAKGTASDLSDVDIAFFIRGYGEKTRFDVGIQLLNLCRGYRAFFEPLVFETADIEKDNPFVNEIIRTGIEI